MNPFATLGLTTTVLRGLLDAQVQSLVSSQYRTLAAIHHPDKGGDAKQFQAIAMAFADLNHAEKRAMHKRDYLKPKKDQLREQAIAFDKLQMQTEQLEARLNTFWLASCRPPEGALSVFDLCGVVITVLNTMGNRLRRTPRGEESLDTPTDVSRDLVVDDTGKIVVYPIQRIYFDKRSEKPPVGIPEKDIYLNDSQPWRSHYSVLCEGYSTDARIVATLASPTNPNERPVPVDGLLAGTMTERASQVQAGFTWEQMAQFVPWLSPYVKRGDELLGATVMGTSIRFGVLGQVLRLRPVT